MKERALETAINEQADALIELAMKIWENPEISWREVKASRWQADYLKEQGFNVELGAYGVPTAIRAVWGSGHPIIGFCGEYDALPGLSQKKSTNKEAVVPGGPGHGCGHNLLGVGTIAACLGLKAELEANGKEGTVIYYGCPAEEVLTGKGFMAREGAFAECDFTLTWHPATISVCTLGAMTGIESAHFRFHGRTSHAAGNPEAGRSALDAVQLMNMGCEFLREHIPSDVRVHYTITDGGLAPNIVPDYAASHYFVRALSRDTVTDVFERVVRCAEGAAHMTDTVLEIERTGGIYPTLQNSVIGNAVYAAAREIPLCEYTEEELKFADEINRCSPHYVEGSTKPISPEMPEMVNFNDYASTDYGDVSHIVPGFQYVDCTAATLSGSHTWMITSCSGSSIGMKGMLRAGKVMAAGAYTFCEQPELLEKAVEEFKNAMGGKSYVCPITDEIKRPF